jgi:hypothetical protein
MKTAIRVVGAIVAVAMCIDILFVFLHFFNEDLIRQIIK